MNKICVIFIAIFLSLPIYAEESLTILPTNEIKKNEDVNIISNSNNMNVNSISLNYKKPIGKRKIAKRFLFAMSGVVISSILLFIILSLYNKIRDGLNVEQEIFLNETELKTPENQRDAVKTFLEKTKWDI